MQNDPYLDNKPTSDVARTSAIPTTGTSSILDGKNPGASSSSAADSKPGVGLFDAQGAIGKQFTTEGAIGGAAQAIGGPLDSKGAIGQHFTTDGAIGGAAQQNLGSSK